MKFAIYQDSRTGGRANNEDRTSYCYSRNALLMVVADGMGGYDYGEVAAQLTVQTFVDSFQREASPRLPDPFRFLQETMLRAQDAIVRHAEHHHMTPPPRSTCVACVVQNSVAYWAHVGDSRLYLMRNAKIAAQTRDHSSVRLMLEKGLIEPSEVSTHPERNRIYSALGGYEPPEIAFSRKVPLERGDVLLLCTDGLWDPVNSEEMARRLEHENIMKVLPQLLSIAEQRGGPNADNASAVVMRWEENYLDDPASHMSMMGDDDQATTLVDMAQVPEHYQAQLSEAEIDRAIAEIRATIERYTPNRP